MGTAIKHPVPDRVKQAVMYNFWHPGTLTLSWASECPDVKNYKWLSDMTKLQNPFWHRMLYSCTHMATVGVKGLKYFEWVNACIILCVMPALQLCYQAGHDCIRLLHSASTAAECCVSADPRGVWQIWRPSGKWQFESSVIPGMYSLLPRKSNFWHEPENTAECRASLGLFLLYCL